MIANRDSRRALFTVSRVQHRFCDGPDSSGSTAQPGVSPPCIHRVLSFLTDRSFRSIAVFGVA